MSSINNNNPLDRNAPTPPTDPAQPTTQLPAPPVPSALEGSAQSTTDQILERAGLRRTAEGVSVRDVGTLGTTRSAEGLGSAEKLFSSSEIGLKPPAAPRIELNDTLRRGAENFARNLDAALNNL